MSLFCVLLHAHRYSDNQFDQDFIEVLRTAVMAFIDRKV
jgi:hypothetical protein